VKKIPSQMVILILNPLLGIKEKVHQKRKKL
jgi:hypothetical protein